MGVLFTPAGLGQLPCLGLVSGILCCALTHWSTAGLTRVSAWELRHSLFRCVPFQSLGPLLPCAHLVFQTLYVNMVVSFFCPLMAFWGFSLCLAGGEFSSLIYSWEGSFDKYHPLISFLRKCLLCFYLCQISSSYWELTYCCAQNKTTVFMDLHSSAKK